MGTCTIIYPYSYFAPFVDDMDMLDLIYSFISLQTEVVYTIMINIAKNIFM